MALDLARQRLSAAWQRRLDLVNYPVIVFFCAVLLYFSVPLAFNAWSYRETSFSAWNPPIWPTKVAVPLALALMLFQALVEFFHVVFDDPANDDKRRYGRVFPRGGPVSANAILLLMFGGLSVFMLTACPLLLCWAACRCSSP